MPGHESGIARLLDEEAGVPAEDIRAQQILDRIQDFRMADHLVDPGKQHVAAMAHLALDRTAAPRLVVFEPAAEGGDFTFAQDIDGKMVATLAIGFDIALAEGFRHWCPPLFFLFCRDRGWACLRTLSSAAARPVQAFPVITCGHIWRLIDGSHRMGKLTELATKHFSCAS